MIQMIAWNRNRRADQLPSPSRVRRGGTRSVEIEERRNKKPEWGGVGEATVRGIQWKEFEADEFGLKFG
ncbi:hypothetical protein HPP92_002024 [Vanilla planifolia]|uniref:Uncharacterized protein n=1 Tax=Vanilla planifolia TaxID=51239 RepID=A0A835VK76_VANPL|nr:hypothetical protein HPP92_002024 [Vanilla planifolia]